jgi:hypothetical protein
MGSRRSIATCPLLAVGVAVAWPASTARAAAWASSGSDLPRRRRSCRSCWLPSTTCWWLAARKRASPAPSLLVASTPQATGSPRVHALAEQLLVAGGGGRDRDAGHGAAELIGGVGDVDLGVGVDADGALGRGGVGDRGDGRLLPGDGAGWHARRPGGQHGDGSCDRLLSGHLRRAGVPVGPRVGSTGPKQGTRPAVWRVRPSATTTDRASQPHPHSGVGLPLGVVQDLPVGPPTGSQHPGGQPVHHDRLADLGHLRKPLAQVSQAGDEGAVGLAVPHGGKLAEQQVQAVADLGLEIPTMRAARRYDSPSSSTAATASKRTSNANGRVPPRPGGRGGSRWARRPASQASTCRSPVGAAISPTKPSGEIRPGRRRLQAVLPAGPAPAGRPAGVLHSPPRNSPCANLTGVL